MRIQHNILAMNAYRNYNTNTSALAKNLEKLSSGYKINRAGDDAAGLAISEKMRAQITGLSAASKNVKDGISLVKTAEGAMQEIQDMLNRMDYLATQSANGTYQDEVDREALQKEVNQLNEEINRIAESANFNGIKLLDGTWDADAKVRGVAAAQKALDAANAALTEAQKPVTVTPVQKDLGADDIKDMMLPTDSNGGPGAPGSVGNVTILETGPIKLQEPSFQVSMNGTNYIMGTNGTTAGDTNGVVSATDGLKLTIGGGHFTLTEQDMQAYLVNEKGMAAADIKAGTKLSSEDLAGAIAYKIQNNTAGNGVGSAAAALTGVTDKNVFNDGTYAWNVSAKGDNVVFEFNDQNVPPTASLNKYYDTSVKAEYVTPLTNATVKATAGSFTTSLTAGVLGTGGTPADGHDNAYTITAKIGGETLTFKADGLDYNAGADDVAAALNNATATNAAGETVKLKDYFTITSDVAGGKNDLIFTDKTKGEAGSGNSITGIAFEVGANTTAGTTGNTAPAAGALTETKGKDAYTIGIGNGYINAGTEVVIPGVPAKPDQLASTTLDFTNLDITDGMKVKLGDTTYTFAVGADSKFKNEANMIDLTDLTAKDLKTVADGGDQNSRSLALSKLTDAAKDNATFTVSHEANGTTKIDQIGLKQKAEIKDSTDMTTLDNFASYIGVSTVDPEATKKAQAAADATREENIKAAQAKVDEAKKNLTAAEGVEGGKALNLQIGDTSDDFNQLGVKIGSMKTAALGVDGLKIDTAETDAAAIDTIKSAINYVSSVRGDLGAYQNRLEHTANNLSVMTENITDAESTIRDTDIAEEMMAYTKNNILVQSAQAMLAQANAVPQGVLQLLG